MSSLSLAPEIISSIRVEIDNLKAFIDVLKKEEHALIEGVIGDLQTYASVKSKLIDKLTKFSFTFHKHMGDHGLELEMSNLNNFFLDQSESKIIWEEFMEFALLAKELNNSNKMIISALIHHNRCAYTALHCAAEKISVYSSRGQVCT